MFESSNEMDEWQLKCFRDSVLIGGGGYERQVLISKDTFPEINFVSRVVSLIIT